MDASANYLSLNQKIRLALSILAIYWPIRVYINISPLSWAVAGHNLPFLATEGVLTFAFLLGWVFLMDELQGRLMHRFGQVDTGELRLPTQVVTLVVAVGLALLFNDLFGLMHRHSEQRLERQFPTLGRAPDDQLNFRPDDRGQRRRMNNGLTVMALLAAFYLTVNRRSTRRIQQLQLQAERLEKEAVQAQFDALKNQVNPHFLFNSLSILSSLVEIDPKLSVQFINRLSKAYRYILEQRDAEQIPLRTELEFIESYTFLLSIRFDERLQVIINVPDTDRDRYQIAPLTLQLLVENAVKHNRMSDEEPLIVCIDREGDYLRVTNPLQPRPRSEESTGVGLTNIVNRYRLLSDLPVWVGEADGDFVVKIPLLS